jgi:excisionase family DNA binding protein
MDNAANLGDSGSAVPTESAEPLPEVLTVDELARLLRVERKTAYAAIGRGEVPGVQRVGRCIRISCAAVLRWLAEGENERTRRGRKAA